MAALNGCGVLAELAVAAVFSADVIEAIGVGVGVDHAAVFGGAGAVVGAGG